MGPWDTVEEVVEEEIDIFAELGALKPVTAPVPTTHGAAMMTTSNDPLAAFMDDEEEETLTADSLFSLEDEPAGAFEFTPEPQNLFEHVAETVEAGPLQEPTPVLSNEVITDLLEILVKNELQARVARGEDWLSDLPAEAIANIESAKIVKEQEAYHLSLIIDMVGTGQVRPFATVLATGDGVLPVSPPAHLSQSWLPLYNALRELLVQAMSALSKVNVLKAKAAA